MQLLDGSSTRRYLEDILHLHAPSLATPISSKRNNYNTSSSYQSSHSSILCFCGCQVSTLPQVLVCHGYASRPAAHAVDSSGAAPFILGAYRDILRRRRGARRGAPTRGNCWGLAQKLKLVRLITGWCMCFPPEGRLKFLFFRFFPALRNSSLPAWQTPEESLTPSSADGFWGAGGTSRISRFLRMTSRTLSPPSSGLPRPSAARRLVFGDFLEVHVRWVWMDLDGFLHPYLAGLQVNMVPKVHLKPKHKHLVLGQPQQCVQQPR